MNKMNGMKRMIINVNAIRRRSHVAMNSIKYNNIMNKRYINISSILYQRTVTTSIMDNNNNDSDKYGNVNFKYVKTAIQKQNHLIIDVRSTDISKQGSIPGSINVPLSFFTIFANNATCRKTMKSVFGCVIDYDQKIIVFCQQGGTSLLAKILLNTLGYKNVYNYKGSYEDWMDNEY